MSVPLFQKFKLPNGVEYEQPLGLFINGEFVTGKEGKAFDVVNPATGNVVGQVHEATAEDVDIAVDAAETAFYDGPWPKMSSAQRGKLLLKLAELFEENLEILRVAIHSTHLFKWMEWVEMEVCASISLHYITSNRVS
ncbi:Aldehyde/histidinol dehydrogenase [Lipomyces starkeyi]